jgi:hypothetical protein
VDPSNWVINNTGTIVQDNSLAVSDISKNEDILISPNPNSGIFTIANLNEKAQINVIDMFGKIVKKVDFEPSSFLNIKDLESGNYLLEILLPSNQKRLKLIQF